LQGGLITGSENERPAADEAPKLRKNFFPSDSRQALGIERPRFRCGSTSAPRPVSLTFVCSCRVSALRSIGRFLPGQWVGPFARREFSAIAFGGIRVFRDNNIRIKEPALTRLRQLWEVTTRRARKTIGARHGAVRFPEFGSWRKSGRTNGSLRYMAVIQTIDPALGRSRGRAWLWCRPPREDSGGARGARAAHPSVKEQDQRTEQDGKNWALYKHAPVCSSSSVRRSIPR